MGREVQTICVVGAQREAVKALLEATELIVRGAVLKKRYPIAALTQLRVSGEQLVFRVGEESIALELGAVEAAKWLQKINTPPPTLAAKLGISTAQPAWVWGALDDPALIAAVSGAQAQDPSTAAVLIAVVLTPEALAQAVALHATLPCRGLWAVYEKGKASPFGDAAVREALRARGYRDNKTAAISERLTATRYFRAE